MTTSTAARPRSTALWIEARFASYARWCVLIAVFVTPLIFAQGGITTFHLPKLALVWYLAWIALGFSWIRSTVASSVRPVRSWLLRASALYLFVAALATANSPYLPLPVIGMYGRYQGFVTHIAMVALLLAIVRTFAGHPERLDALAVAAVAAGGIVACYVVVQEAGLDWMQWRELGFAPRHIGRATLGNSNFAGGFLGMVSPLCLYLALTRDRAAARELYAATLAVILLAIWFTASRGAMLAAAVGFATLALAYRSYLKKVIGAAGTKRVVYALLAVLLATAVVYFNPLQNRSSGPRDLLRSSSLEQRVERWKAGLHAIGRNPWLGTGPDTFYATFPPNRGEEKELEEFTNNAHNIFIEHANGKGLLGLGAYLLLIGSAGFFSVRRSRQIAGRERFRLVAFGSVLAAYLAQGFFSIDVIGIAVMGWTVLGTLAVMADPLVLATGPEGEVAETAVHSPRRRAFSVAAIIAVLAPMLVLPVFPLGSDYAARAAQRSATLAEFNRLFDHARQLNPYEADYPYRQGYRLARLAEEASEPATVNLLYRQATANLEEALRLRPHEIGILMDLASVYSRWGEASSDLEHFRQSDRLWEEALALDPLGYRVRNGLARNLNAWIAAANDPTLRPRQISTLQESLRIQPHQPKAAARLAGAYNAAGRAQDSDALLTEQFGRPLTEPERSAVAESELDDKRLRRIVEQWQDRPAEIMLPELIARIENDPRTVSQDRLERLITIGVLGIVVIAAVAITQRLGSQRSDGDPENEPGLLYVSERKLLQQLTPYRGLRWLAIPGLWSLALSLPYLALLIGPASNYAHRAEVAAHTVPGLILVTAAAFYDRRAYLAGGESTAYRPVWRWALLGLGIVMVVLHFPPISPPPSGSPAWSKLLMHLVPAFMTILISRPEIFTWLRGHSTAHMESS